MIKLSGQTMYGMVNEGRDAKQNEILCRIPHDVINLNFP